MPEMFCDMNISEFVAFFCGDRYYTQGLVCHMAQNDSQLEGEAGTCSSWLLQCVLMGWVSYWLCLSSSPCLWFLCNVA